jgi:hypothetical protein
VEIDRFSRRERSQPILQEGERLLIQNTCTAISELQERAEADRDVRYARRKKIRAIDQIINDFEMLNLAEEVDVPGELRHRANRFIVAAAHPLVKRSYDQIPIADWMEALYDLQDTLMLPSEDDLD